MVDAVVSYTIEKLDQFVTKQVSIRTGVKDGIAWLKDELGYLLISVRDAEAHQDKEHIRLWTDSIRDVANQAVVILERFSAQQEEHAAAEQGGVLDRMRSFICICKKEATLFDIGKDIESLKEKLIRIKSRRDEYRINDIIMAPPTVHQRKRTSLRSASFDHEKDVVGFEDDVQTLLAQLGNKDLSLGFISIHGMGGLGKSTLASKLYHSSELSHFKRSAWVCVSEDYDIRLVLRKIINAFNGHQPDLLNNMEDLELLRRHLRKTLQDGDHYLLVIDDVWDVQVWNQIKNAFPDKNGSRVIITTRSSVVANDVDETCFVHELRFLRKDESWQLFCKKAKPTPNLEILGKEMVGKCGGLPLAIVILSGLLLQKKTYEFWSDVKDHLWRKLKGKSSEIQEVLNLSYIDLSPPMRQCFLYLARYPEDHIIEVSELKLLWIAEEFVLEAEEEDGVDMEDVAEDYLNELINRNMIQIARMSIEGQVEWCRVHDLIRDLAIEKAKEQKVLGIFDSSKHHTNPIHSLQGQSRHAIYNGIGEYLKLQGPNSDNSKLRSIAVTTSETFSEEVQLKLMFSRFIYLKVLNLTRVLTSGGIPKEIGDLVLLKFLGLMGSKSYKDLVIPPSVGNLKRLQTLCGPKSYSSAADYVFPKEIGELKELRHLKFDNIEGNSNISRDQKKLRTIETIAYKEWSHIDTINLTNLRTLTIAKGGGEEAEYSLGSIANLTSLQQLSLYFYGGGNVSTLQPLSSCKHLKKVWLNCSIKDVVELSFLPDSVTDLTLVKTRFTEDPMPTLGSLPNLTVLRLDSDAFLGDKMVCSANMFPSLQFLILGFLFNLEEIQVDDGALPSLKALKSDSRRLMNKLPQRIKSLPSEPAFWGWG